MAPSVNPPLTSKNPSSRAEDARSPKTPTLAEEGPWAGRGSRELPEVAPRAEALDAKWQSAIDAATD